LENNKKLRQKLKEEIECLSKIDKLNNDVGNMDVESLIRDKKRINEKSETLLKEVINNILLFNNQGIIKIILHRKIKL